MTTTCLACRDQPVTDTFTCGPCGDLYHGLLPRVPDLAAELETEITRQARKGGQSGGGRVRNHERPLEYNQAASDALAQLRAVLVSTCLTLALGQALPDDTIPAMTEWLIDNEGAVPLRPEAGDMIAGLEAAVKRGQTVIDNPPERVYFGNCPCGEELVAERGAAFVQCPSARCGAMWSMDAVVDHRNQIARDYLMTLPELVAMKVASKATIYRWSKRLEQRGMRDGMDVYAFGDVLDMKLQGRLKSA